MPIEFTVKYDKVSDALYIKLKEGVIADSEELAPGVIVNYNERGGVVGIEVLGVSK